MTHPIEQCDTKLLEQLLRQQLSDEQEVTVSDHVSQCAGCQAQLESLAGDGSWWTRVHDSLQSHDSDHDVAQSKGDTRSKSLNPFDFAVEFLEPSERKGSIGKLGDIEILELIGRGGMGVVLKGHQSELQRPVVVKVMAPHLAANGSARKRFAREARAAAAVVHPHVMAIHSVDATARLPFIVMPYIASESLQQRIDRDGELDVCEILRISMQTASALAAAHAQGLVHRDVKPGNILLERGVERALLTDFGLARAVDDATLTRTGVIAGTPLFMSPEQACGEPIDERSDLFSLGSVLYAMCTGHPPFRAETSLGVLRRITDSEPRPIRDVNPTIPEWLEVVVGRLLEKDPKNRIQTAQSLAELLENCLQHVQQPRTVPLPPIIATMQSQDRELTREKLIKSSALGFVTIMICIGLFFVFRAPNKAAQETNEKPTAIHDLSPALDPDQLLPWGNDIQNEIDSIDQTVQSLESNIDMDWD